MTTVLSPAEERVLLQGVSWETYERLLADQRDRSAPRLTYDRGRLEIMSPSGEHEEINDRFKYFVLAVAEELDLELRSFGSKTFKRADLAKGFEPDSCFYIQSVERVADTRDPDLTLHPPPDLVVEIDLSHPSLDKLPVYAQAGVPELWVYDGRAVTISVLRGDAYAATETSLALPPVTAAVLTHFIAEARDVKLRAWLRRVREWARAA
ncbi:MAG TPA: Uma2 family endonuclease [Pyrinomonadaceae bacterium]|jgi:Uma2 family endonuclease